MTFPGGARISDAERSRALGWLEESRRNGRIDDAELAARRVRVDSAQNAGELYAVFVDLPEGWSGSHRGRFWWGIPTPVAVAFGVLLIGGGIAFSVSTHLPPYFLFPFGWLFVWLFVLRAFWWRRAPWRGWGYAAGSFGPAGSDYGYRGNGYRQGWGCGRRAMYPPYLEDAELAQTALATSMQESAPADSPSSA